MWFNVCGCDCMCKCWCLYVQYVKVFCLSLNIYIYISKYTSICVSNWVLVWAYLDINTLKEVEMPCSNLPIYTRCIPRWNGPISPFSVLNEEVFGSSTAGMMRLNCPGVHRHSLGILSLRMVSWNQNTLRFGGDFTPQSSFDKVIGSLGISYCWVMCIYQVKWEMLNFVETKYGKVKLGSLPRETCCR